MDLISVIIPVFNKGKYVEKSIISVLHQTYQNFEIIVLNDGSTDNSEEIIVALQNQDARIRYIKQDNKGVAASRNIGIEQASGKYICFLDADDYLDRTFLEKMREEIRGYDVCYCGYNYIYPSSKQKKCKTQFIKGDILTAYFYNRCTPNANCWMIKRAFLMQHHIRYSEDIDWGEDMLFLAKVLTLNKKVQCVKEFLTFYHTRVEDSLSTNNIDKFDKDFEWINLYNEFLFDNEENVKRREATNNAIMGYRLPALIIYRLWTSKQALETKEYEEIYGRFKNIIMNIKFNNGLRSIKLYIYRTLI